MKKFVWMLCIFLFHSPCWAYQQGEDLSIEASKQRMSPPSQLVVSGVAPTGPDGAGPVMEPGQKVYQKFCQVCHAAGIAGAPKTGNNAQWMQRYKDGWSVLMQRAINGYKGMPAKGHCTKCSEAQIHEAIEYMLERSGIDTEKS